MIEAGGNVYYLAKLAGIFGLNVQDIGTQQTGMSVDAFKAKLRDANEYKNADEGWGIPVSRPFPGDAALSWHIIESLVAEEFDVTTCQEMLVDHAFTIPLALLWPGADNRPVGTVPIEINTVQHPLPTPARCLKLGQAIGRAIERYAADISVLVVGSGGLSHQLDGKRAGFINKEFDLMCLDKLVSDPTALTRYSTVRIVEEGGSQGVEILNWIAMRGAFAGQVTKVHSNYHIPISNTASGLLVLQNDPPPVEMRKAG